MASTYVAPEMLRWAIQSGFTSTEQGAKSDTRGLADASGSGIGGESASRSFDTALWFSTQVISVDTVVWELCFHLGEISFEKRTKLGNDEREDLDVA